jgi:hypothetical protein
MREGGAMTCEHDGCDREGNPCFLLDDPPDKPSYHFCGDHAHEEGFCRGCGGFFGGIESFEFGYGLCDYCEVECEDEIEDLDPWTPDPTGREPDEPE